MQRLAASVFASASESPLVASGDDGVVDEGHRPLEASPLPEGGLGGETE